MKIPIVNKGDPIKATWLTGVAKQVNTLSDKVLEPKEVGFSGEVYQEESRTTATQRVTSPDDEDTYIDVEVMTSVTMSKSDGTRITLVFNAP